jgi:hypothetical protein
VADGDRAFVKFRPCGKREPLRRKDKDGSRKHKKTARRSCDDGLVREVFDA